TVNFQGRMVRLTAKNAARKNPYVKGLRINRRSWKKPWLHLGALRRGAKLDWKLSSSPSGWGRGRKLAPPSFGDR
ncbi:MAG: hypothetical protein KDB64_02190, partial [Solirubrobacterales bacterium]|nr:hypothetical protein [Solirubrobacterales bacterium]